MLELNLLPFRAELKKAKKNKIKMELGLAFLAGTLILCLFHFMLIEQTKLVRTKLTQRQKGLAKVNQRLEVLRQRYQDVAYQKIPEFDFATLLKRQRNVLTVLRKLKARLPPNSALTQIRFDEKAWIIEGYSTRIEPILHFSESIKKEMKVEALESVLKKEKFMDLRRKNGLVYYQLRFEAG